MSLDLVPAYYRFFLFSMKAAISRNLLIQLVRTADRPDPRNHQGAWKRGHQQVVAVSGQRLAKPMVFL